MRLALLLLLAACQPATVWWDDSWYWLASLLYLYLAVRVVRAAWRA